MTKRNRKSSPFFYRRDRDGVDEVFDIVSRESGSVIASIPFWDEAKRAEADARLAVAALSKLCRIGQNINFHRSIEFCGHVAMFWNTDDVVFRRPDLSHEQAWKVLQRCRRIHADLDFTSRLIEIIAQGMFPKADEGDGK